MFDNLLTDQSGFQVIAKSNSKAIMHVVIRKANLTTKPGLNANCKLYCGQIPKVAKMKRIVS